MTTAKRFVAGLAALCMATAARAGETITYFHTDLASTPVVATDVNGIQVWKETYRPYGDQLIDAAASQNNQVWFTGKPFDEASGLSYFGARYYDPALGRFMGVDPAALDPGDLYAFNRYAYANNNPYRFVDPDGQASLELLLIPVAATVLVIGGCQASGSCEKFGKAVWEAGAELNKQMLLPYVAAALQWSGRYLSESGKSSSESGASAGMDKSGTAATPPDPDDDEPGHQELRYQSIRKHEEGGWGTKMDLDPSTAQRTLNNSIQSGRARYGLNNGKPYEFKYDNAGNWHGYPVRGNEVPTSVLRQWLKDGDITRAGYMRLLSGG